MRRGDWSCGHTEDQVFVTHGPAWLARVRVRESSACRVRSTPRTRSHGQGIPLGQRQLAVAKEGKEETEEPTRETQRWPETHQKPSKRRGQGQSGAGPGRGPARGHGGAETFSELGAVGRV